jgi:methionyl aminopeptidase
MGLVTNPTDLDRMRAACKDAARVLDFITPYVKPGVTTGELDKLCLDFLTNVLQVKSATLALCARRSTTKSAMVFPEIRY